MRHLLACFVLSCLLGTIGLLQQLGLLHAQGRGRLNWQDAFSDLWWSGSGQIAGLSMDAVHACLEEPRTSTLPAGSTSIIAASANRSSSLLQVLPSWLAALGVAEIVLVDWTSAPAVADVLPPNTLGDPRVRLIRVIAENEWNLARAYNLAATLARGELLLKVDADTSLHPLILQAQRLPVGGGFLRGCRDAAPDENARHLNGVLLARRVDVIRVLGYDERMRRYGFDDTDLYARLSEGRNLSSSCLRFGLMEHTAGGHSERGLTHVHHILHRRATRGGIFPKWHEARLPPSAWALVRGVGAGEPGSTKWSQPVAQAAAVSDGLRHSAADTDIPPPSISGAKSTSDRSASADTDPILAIYGSLSVDNASSTTAKATTAGAVCELVAIRRPPFFDELLRNTNELLLAHQEALLLYSNRKLKSAIVGTIESIDEVRTLTNVYINLLQRGKAYIAVRPMHGLVNRLRAYCSAAAYARQTRRRLLVVWEPDVHCRARFEDVLIGALPSDIGRSFAHPVHGHMAEFTAGALVTGSNGIATAASTVPTSTSVVEPPSTDVALPASVEVIGTYSPGLFPVELWKRHDHMSGSERTRRRNPVGADNSDRRSLLVSTAYRLESVPAVEHSLYATCLRSLKPTAAVAELLRRTNVDTTADVGSRDGSDLSRGSADSKETVNGSKSNNMDMDVDMDARQVRVNASIADSARLSANAGIAFIPSNARAAKRVTSARYAGIQSLQARSAGSRSNPMENASDVIGELRAAAEVRVGVHIRMEPNMSVDLPGIEIDDRPESNMRKMQEARPYREACHYAYFLPIMHEWQQAEPRVRFYLASDSAEAYERVSAAFRPGVVQALPPMVRERCVGPATKGATSGNNSGRRGVICQQAALADLISLAASKKLLLSHWSSWSDVLLAMVPRDTPHRSGCKSLVRGVALKPASMQGAVGGANDAIPSLLGSAMSIDDGTSGVGGLASDAARGAPHLGMGGTPRGSTDDGVANSGIGGSSRMVDGATGAGGTLGSGSSGGGGKKHKETASRDSSLVNELLKGTKAMPGLSVQRVAAMDALPDRPGDIRVRVHKSKEMAAALPKNVRNLRLVLLIPQRMFISALAARIGKMLQLLQSPTLRLGYRANAGGEPMDVGRTIGEYFESHRDAGDGFLHVVLDLRH